MGFLTQVIVMGLDKVILGIGGPGEAAWHGRHCSRCQQMASHPAFHAYPALPASPGSDLAARIQLACPYLPGLLSGNMLNINSVRPTVTHSGASRAALISFCVHAAGDSARFVTSNPEAMQALMKLHPLALVKPARDVPAQPPAESPVSQGSSPSALTSRSALKRRAPISDAAYRDLLHAQVGSGIHTVFLAALSHVIDVNQCYFNALCYYSYWLAAATKHLYYGV